MKTRNNALKKKQKSKSCLPKKLCHEKKGTSFPVVQKDLKFSVIFHPYKCVVSSTKLFGQHHFKPNLFGFVQKTCRNVKICAKNKSVPTILFETKIQKLL